MRLSKARWLLRRLSAMGPQEILHRVVELGRKRQWAGDRRGWSAFPLADGPLEAPARLADRLRGPWPDDILRDLAGAADEIRQGRIALLGRDWSTDSRIDDPGFWLTDPVTGRRWPGEELYCFAVPYRDGTVIGLGDVKYVWEANRWQILLPFAVMAAQGDPEARALLIRSLSAWMEANPPFRGVNWSSCIELAFRLMSLAVIVAALDGQTLEPGFRTRLRACVAAHAFWMARYPSLYSSANNHRLAEGLGLAAAATLIPDHPGAPAWAHEGEAIVATLTPTLFAADGIYLEQTPSYGAGALEMLAGYALLRGHLPAAAQACAERGLAAARVFLDTAGYPPRIGDDDEGRILPAPRPEPRFVASALAATAAAIGRPDLAPADFDRGLRTVLCGVTSRGAAAADGVHLFREGGYSVVRGPVSGRAMLLAFDHGPLGHLSIAAHGHADALAIWLHLDDQPILVDAGTYLYHSGGRDRDLFRSTAVHNTLRVAGAEQSIPAGAFNWSHKATGRLLAAETGPDWSLTADHDGYVKRFGVRPTRTLSRQPNGFRVEDSLADGDRRWPIDAGFLIHPTLDVTLDGAAATISRAGAPLLRLTMAGPADLSVSVVRGSGDPRPGLYSAAFSAREPAPMIVATATLGAGETLTTRVEVLPA